MIGRLLMLVFGRPLLALLLFQRCATVRDAWRLSRGGGEWQ